MSDTVRVVAIIPARGGSKGIKRKNLRPVGGTPLIVRTVQSASAASLVDLVVVTSDDQEILAAAAGAGARPLLRPAAISGDTASSESALLHALDALAKQGVEPEVVVFLQCTSPFLTEVEVDALVAALDRNPSADAALTVSPNHGFLWRRGPDGQAIGVNHDATRPRQRRQDLEPEYRENGAGYAMRIGPFRALETRFCGRVELVETTLPIVEIDDEDDLAIVDAMIAVRGRPTLDPEAARRIRVLVTDFDGVHTDDQVYVGDDGREHVRCSRSDGLGISLLRDSGVQLLILSKEENPVVSQRARKLRAEVLQGIGDKTSVLSAWLAERAISFDEVAYLGNDLNDLSCLRKVGLALVPADAHASVRDHAIVLQRVGGGGVVREACDLILRYRG